MGAMMAGRGGPDRQIYGAAIDMDRARGINHGAITMDKGAAGMGGEGMVQSRWNDWNECKSGTKTDDVGPAPPPACVNCQTKSRPLFFFFFGSGGAEG